jgi:hypothetical protein
MNKCEVCGSTQGFHMYEDRQPLCGRHISQMYRYGRILIHTQFDPNKIVNRGTYYEIILYKREHEVGRAKIDKKHLKKIQPYKWHLSKGYSRCNELGISMQIHLFGYKKNREIDHRNGDKLDNRTQNIRFTTHQQNLWNRHKLHKRNKSGYPGIWWDQKTQNWQVKICYNWKQIFLGRFKSKKHAIIIRRAAELKYFGEYAPTKRAG